MARTSFDKQEYVPDTVEVDRSFLLDADLFVPVHFMEGNTELVLFLLVRTFSPSVPFIFS